MSPLLNRRATLKDALSLLLDADVQAGIVVDRDGRVLGIVTVEMIAEVMREGDHVVPDEPQPPEDDLAALPGCRGGRRRHRGAPPRRSRCELGLDPEQHPADRRRDDRSPDPDRHRGQRRVRDQLRLRPADLPGGGSTGRSRASRASSTRSRASPCSFLVPVTGLSVLTAEIALIGYTLLILIRSIVGGLDSVQRDITEAADGMGYSWRGRLFGVDLPLAVPLIIAGLRVATVTTVGLVMVTALIGRRARAADAARVQLRNTTAVYVGAIMTVLLAVSLDLVVVAIGRIATPWARRAGT